MGLDSFLNYIGTAFDNSASTFGGTKIEGYSVGPDGELRVRMKDLTGGSEWEELASDKHLRRVPFRGEQSLAGYQARKEKDKEDSLKQKREDLLINALNYNRRQKEQDSDRSFQINTRRADSEGINARANQTVANTGIARVMEDARQFDAQMPLKEQQALLALKNQVLDAKVAAAEIEASKEDIAMRRDALQTAKEKTNYERALNMALLQYEQEMGRHESIWGQGGALQKIAAGIAGLL